MKVGNHSSYKDGSAIGQDTIGIMGEEGEADGTSTRCYTDYSGVLPHESYNSDWHKKIVDPYFAARLPNKLNEILSDRESSDIITWLPHGRSFIILQRKQFATKVLPKYYQHSNLNSFLRLVNAWGFIRVSGGIDSGSYYHELFLRGMPHLHEKMKRGAKSDKKTSIDSEIRHPNFYDMALPDPDDSTDETSQDGAIVSSSNERPSTLSERSYTSSRSLSNTEGSESISCLEGKGSFPVANRKESDPHQRKNKIRSSHPLAEEGGRNLKHSNSSKNGEAVPISLVDHRPSGVASIQAGQHTNAHQLTKNYGVGDINPAGTLNSENPVPPRNIHPPPVFELSSLLVGMAQRQPDPPIRNSITQTVDSVVNLTSNLLSMPIQPAAPSTHLASAGQSNLQVVDVITHVLLTRALGAGSRAEDRGTREVEMGLQILRRANLQYGGRSNGYLH